MNRGVVHSGPDIFLVPSASAPLSYMVDMNLGLSECCVGKTGASCKHQYVMWSLKKIHSPYFLPIFYSESHRNLAIIAIGSSLPSQFYQGLHQFSSQLPHRKESNILIETIEVETIPREEYPLAAPSNPVHEIMEVNRLKESKTTAMQSLTDI